MKNYYIDMSSAQPFENIKINGGGEYAEIVFSELCKTDDENVITIILDSRKGENLFINKYMHQRKINVIYYKTIAELSQILNKVRHSIIFFPVCYPKYAGIKCDESNFVVTTIHDLSSIYVDNCKYI